LIHLVYDHGGIDLGKLLAASRPSPAQTRACMDHMLGGLQHLHEQRLVHADIKPANVVVFASGEEWFCRVADLGNILEVLVIRVGHIGGTLDLEISHFVTIR
jgi:serine/threonine protein kinase